MSRSLAALVLSIAAVAPAYADPAQHYVYDTRADKPVVTVDVGPLRFAKAKGPFRRIRTKDGKLYQRSGNCMSESDDQAPWSCNLCDDQRPVTLHEAALCHDLAAVKRHVDVEHADPDERDASGRTPLQLAMTSYTTYWHPSDPAMDAITRFLLERGADPDVPLSGNAHRGARLLHFAAYDGRTVLVDWLLEAGADVRALDDKGRTAVHHAAMCDFRLSCDDCGERRGAVSTISHLVAHGADVRARADDGKTALDLVPSPCAGHAGDCNPAGKWISGTCRNTFDLLETLLRTP